MKKKRCILVVDDEPKVLRFIEIGLKNEGFDVTSTTSGKEALKIVKEIRPDIMLLDIIMPEMNGLQVLNQLRSFSRLPVILFSASPQGIQDMKSMGANDFIIKPFDPNEMITRIRKLIGM